MRSTSIKVDSGKIRNAKDCIEKEANAYKTAYENIYKYAGEIFAAEQWLGADARKYHEKLLEFKNDFAELYNHFISYMNFLSKSAEAYETVQEIARKKAGKLTTER